MFREVEVFSLRACRFLPEVSDKRFIRGCNVSPSAFLLGGLCPKSGETNIAFGSSSRSEEIALRIIGFLDRICSLNAETAEQEIVFLFVCACACMCVCVCVSTTGVGGRKKRAFRISSIYLAKLVPQGNKNRNTKNTKNSLHTAIQN